MSRSIVRDAVRGVNVRTYPARPGSAPTSPGLMALEAEVAAESTPQLEVQRALLAGIPPALRPLAGARLRLVADELRRRELAS